MQTDTLTALLEKFKEELVSELSASVVEKLSDLKQHQGEERLYSPAEACKFFHPSISKVTLHSWTSQGLIPSQKIGGRVFYRLSDLVDAGSKLKRYSSATKLAAKSLE